MLMDEIPLLRSCDNGPDSKGIVLRSMTFHLFSALLSCRSLFDWMLQEIDQATGR